MIETIYALVDPRTDEIFYIGRTINPQTRLASHVNRARALAPSDETKDSWIRSLPGNPELRILQRVSMEYAEHAERRWIATGLDAGWPLTNTQHVHGRPFRPLTGQRTATVAAIFKIPASLFSPPRFVPMERKPMCWDWSPRELLAIY